MLKQKYLAKKMGDQNLYQKHEIVNFVDAKIKNDMR